MNKNTIILLIIGLTSLYGQITIQEARQEFGNTVTTSGVVTTTNLASSGQSDFAIQDETAAIIIYNGDFDAGLAMGDLVTVTGEIINYNGKLEIVPGVETDISIESQGNDLPNFHTNHKIENNNYRNFVPVFANILLTRHLILNIFLFQYPYIFLTNLEPAFLFTSFATGWVDNT